MLAHIHFKESFGRCKLTNGTISWTIFKNCFDARKDLFCNKKRSLPAVWHHFPINWKNYFYLLDLVRQHKRAWTQVVLHQWQHLQCRFYPILNNPFTWRENSLMTYLSRTFYPSSLQLLRSNDRPETDSEVFFHFIVRSTVGIKSPNACLVSQALRSWASLIMEAKYCHLAFKIGPKNYNHWNKSHLTKSLHLKSIWFSETTNCNPFDWTILSRLVPVYDHKCRQSWMEKIFHPTLKGKFPNEPTASLVAKFERRAMAKPSLPLFRL